MYRKTTRWCLAFIVLSLLGSGIYSLFFEKRQTSAPKDESADSVQTARVMANGDILIHNGLYGSAEQADGSYDFLPFFEYVTDWISSADLAIGDYEGTISSDYPLAGYPLFNAPAEIALAMKETGYDVVDLAHNHILDSGLSGALQTVNTFEDLGMDCIGIYQENRDKEDFLIKDVNGIKIAILGYSYGYNGMEATLTDSEYKKHLSDLSEDKIKAEIQEAEKKADVTIVMPQMGTEYALEPTEEQVKLYHKMIDWGADAIFGGHPHVPEPCEVVEKTAKRKSFSIQWEISFPINDWKRWMTFGLSVVCYWMSRLKNKKGKHALKMCLPTRRWFGFGARALLVLKVLPCLITARWF